VKMKGFGREDVFVVLETRGIRSFRSIAESPAPRQKHRWKTMSDAGDEKQEDISTHARRKKANRDWTPLGMVIEVRPLQPEKAASPISETLSGIPTDVRPLHSENAPSPIVETPSGMIIEVRALQPWKACSAIPSKSTRPLKGTSTEKELPSLMTPGGSSRFAPMLKCVTTPSAHAPAIGAALSGANVVLEGFSAMPCGKWIVDCVGTEHYKAWRFFRRGKRKKKRRKKKVSVERMPSLC
jgi:hypothetical protein